MAQSPFKFLDAYEQNDRHIFFGREAETEALYEKVSSASLTLLYGSSGTGKTSLIRCGLSNRFAPTDWYAVTVSRRDNLNESFRNEIRHHAQSDIPENASLKEAIETLYYDYYVPVYFIFDQFEELFILGTEEEQEKFFEDLAELTRAGLQARFILSIREEYFARLTRHERMIPHLMDNKLLLERMNRTNLREVIVGTASAFSIEVVNPEQTIEGIIDKIADKRLGVDLTYVQVLMDRLYQQELIRKGDSNAPLTFDQNLLEEIGELEDVLDSFLADQVNEVEKEIGKKGLPMAVLYAMVSDESTKRSVNAERILKLLPADYDISLAEVERCLQEFLKRRIIKALDTE